MLIGDVGGFGKTLEGIEAIKYIQAATGQAPKALVITTNTAREHWVREVATNYSTNVTLLDRYDKVHLNSLYDKDVVVVNVDIFGNKKRREDVTDALMKIRFPYVIIDEAHNIRNPEAFRSTQLRKLVGAIPKEQRTWSPQYFVALTATPIFDTIDDAYILINMLEPDTYPTPRSVELAHKRNPLVIHSVLKRRMLRRGDDGLPSMENVLVELNPDQLAVYTDVLEYDDITPTEKLDQLRKAALDPSLVNPDYISDPQLREKLLEIPSSKYAEVDKIVEKSIAEGEKVVIFSSRFKEGVTKKLEERYERFGALRIDGDLKAGYRGRVSEREMVRQLFQDSRDHCVLVVDPVVSEAISLTGASVGVLLDSGYTWGGRYQLMKRLDRPGQDKSVHFYNLIAHYSLHPKGSIDVGINELVESKRQVAQIVINGGKLKEEEGKLIADIPPSSQKSVVDREFSSRQHLARIRNAMIGMGGKHNLNLIMRNDGRLARDYAEYYNMGWEYSYSAKTAQVYKRIIEGLMGSETFERFADLASGPAVLSRSLGMPTVNVDMNPFFEDTVKAINPQNRFVRAMLDDLPFEDGEFDITLCSLALQLLTQKRDRQGKEIRERERAIREGSRILRKNGIYIAALPDFVSFDKDRFYEGMNLLGLTPIPDLSGRVIATEPPDSKYQAYIITARKTGKSESEVPPEYFAFNIDRMVTESKADKKSLKLPPEPRLEICKDFAFVDPENGTEDIGRRVRAYSSRHLREEVKRKVGTLYTERKDGIEYIVIKYPRRKLITYVPRNKVEQLLEQAKTNYGNLSREELQEMDPKLFKELRRLRLLNLALN